MRSRRAVGKNTLTHTDRASLSDWHQLSHSRIAVDERRIADAHTALLDHVDACARAARPDQQYRRPTTHGAD
jgi:hypothetical protein